MSYPDLLMTTRPSSGQGREQPVVLRLVVVQFFNDIKCLFFFTQLAVGIAKWRQALSMDDLSADELL
jgi:hypothetical protein